MKLRSYEVFYKRVRCLFPNVGTKEGRFLKELKAHLQDFSLVHPNVTYEEIVNFFGTPEEIMKNYIETVTADFYFDGSTSRCTSSSASAGSYTSTHKILSKTSGRSGNSGWAKATVGTYMGGVHVTDVT